MVQSECGLMLRYAEQEGPAMAQRRHTPEQIIRKLAEGQKLLSGGATVEEVCASSASPNRPGPAG